MLLACRCGAPAARGSRPWCCPAAACVGAGRKVTPPAPGRQVEKELSEICSSILQLLDDHLIPTASSGESKVFYLKMKGDYHRYLAEFKTGTDRKDAAEHTLLAYKAAQARPGQLPGRKTRSAGRDRSLWAFPWCPAARA